MRTLEHYSFCTFVRTHTGRLLHAFTDLALSLLTIMSEQEGLFPKLFPQSWGQRIDPEILSLEQSSRRTMPLHQILLLVEGIRKSVVLLDMTKRRLLHQRKV